MYLKEYNTIFQNIMHSLVPCDEKSHRSLRKDKTVSGDRQEKLSFAYDCFHRKHTERYSEISRDYCMCVLGH